MKSIYQFTLFLFASFFLAEEVQACGFNLTTPGTIMSTPVTCWGMMNGTITVNPTGGVPPYQYTLANGSPQTSNFFPGLAPTTYWVKVQDATMCIDSIQVAVTSPPPVLVSGTSTDATCVNSDGEICLNATGGMFPYTFQIVGGSSYSGGSTYCFSNLAPGIYNTLVLDAMGCMSMGPSTFVIQQVSAGTISSTITDTVYDETCHYSGDGGVNITALPGTGLSYSWSTGATSQDLFNAISGNYTVVISSTPNDCIVLNKTVSYIGTNCGTIQGQALVDSNSNCVFDASDFGIANMMISLSNGDQTFTNNNGMYHFNGVPTGSVGITQTFPNANYFANACVQPSSTSISSGTVATENFKDSTLYVCDASVSATLFGLVPGITSSGVIHVQNLQNYLNCGGTVSCVLPSPLVYASATPAPTAVYPVAGGDSLVWNFTTLLPGWWNNQFFINFHCPTTLTLGNSYTLCANVALSGTDINLSNNSHCFTRVVQASFDPNDKAVSPIGIGSIGGITTNDSVLTYMIRFQNTGTAPATNVKLLDTISSKLNLNSLEVLNSSHDYDVSILGSNVLQFHFKNINLIDSNTNEPASHGYITYRIHQKSGNQLGDQIKNTAAIYFDYNSPVITNTTLNTIIAPQSISNVISENDIHLYPVPVQHELQIQFPTIESGLITIEITNTTGQMMKQVSMNLDSSKHLSISTDDMSKGVYHVKVMSNTKVYSKMIVCE